jgi:hypothetical protein
LTVTDYMVKMIGQYAGGIPWTTGVHVTSAQSESALATTWRNAVLNFWLDPAHGVQTLYPTGTVLTETSVATLNATMHEVTKTTTPTAAAGTSTADTLPFQEAVCISLRGNSVQKTGRGRMFLPALAEDQVNNDVVIGAATARISTAIKAVFAAINADGSTFFVTPVNVKKPPKNGVPLYTKTVVTSPLVSNKPARQSRRVRKVAASYT